MRTVSSILVWLILVIQGAKLAPPSHKFGDAGSTPVRFDYRQTFKRPIYAGKNKHVPYFNYSGDVVISRDYIRLASSLPFQYGILRCDTPNKHKGWMVEFSMSIYGKSSEGGHGLVFWYIDDFEKAGRNFYGYTAEFRGLAVVFDTSDVEQSVIWVDLAI